MTETKSGLPWLREEKNEEKNPRAKTNEPFSTATPTSLALNWPLKVPLKNHSASGEDGVSHGSRTISSAFPELKAHGSVKRREQGGIRCCRPKWGFSEWEESCQPPLPKASHLVERDGWLIKSDAWSELTWTAWVTSPHNSPNLVKTNHSHLPHLIRLLWGLHTIMYIKVFGNQ